MKTIVANIKFIGLSICIILPKKKNCYKCGKQNVMEGLQLMKIHKA